MPNDVNNTIQTLKDLAASLDAGQASPDVAMDAVRKGLAHSSPRVVKRAAIICRDQRMEELTESLLATYLRLLEKPQRSDPGCDAKLATVEALRHLDFADVDFYLAVLHYRQSEPVWGGSIDTASELRVSAAMALVRLGVPDLVLNLVDLMVDPEPAARAGAVRALAASARMESEPLLRLKLFMGDERAEVMGECFAGLLGMHLEKSFELVAAYLEGEDTAIRNEAAIAIGESRHPAALSRLQKAFESASEPEDQRALALTIALMRSSEANDYLVAWIRADDAERAVATIIALRHCREMEGVVQRVRQAANSCDHRYIARTFNEEFG